MAKVQGYIYNQSGRALSNVRVSIGAGPEVFTDANGRFTAECSGEPSKVKIYINRTLRGEVSNKDFQLNFKI